MHYVMPCLHAEGTTDRRLVGRILERLLEFELFNGAQHAFEIADIVYIGDSAGLLEPEAVVTELSVADVGLFSIVFVHRDADSRDLSKAEPWMRRLDEQIEDGLRDRRVFVIPIRMSEAWGLVDGDALRSALGVTWDDSTLGVPGRPSAVEKMADPKARLVSLAERVSGPDVDLYARVADRVDLNLLKQVPSFQRAVDGLTEVLQSQGVIE